MYYVPFIFRVLLQTKYWAKCTEQTAGQTLDFIIDP